MAKLLIYLTKMHLNYTLLIGILILLFSCDSKNVSTQKDSTIDIAAVLDSQVVAWNKADLKGFMAGYEKSDSLQFITKRGRTLGWEKVYNSYISHYPTKKEMGTLHFKNLIIKPMSDSLAQVYGNWLLVKDTNAEGNFSLIMKRKRDGWKIIVDHTW